MFLIFNICYALSRVLLPNPPRQFLKISVNVIQFKAFNVNSTGQATFSTSEFAAWRQGKKYDECFSVKFFLKKIGANCSSILFHYLQTVLKKKYCILPFSLVCAQCRYLQAFSWFYCVIWSSSALQTIVLIQLQLFAKCYINYSSTVCGTVC